MIDPSTFRPEDHRRVLIVAPHPDDETLAAAGLIQRVQAAGGTVRVLLLTDGDANPWPQRWLERRLRIGPADRARWGRRRRDEWHAALDLLGVPVGERRALGWPDMGLTARLALAPALWRAPLVRELKDFRPDLVVLPALADRHPDHGAAHVLMRLALAAWTQEPPALLGYPVHVRDVPGARIEVPASAAFMAQKERALACHRTQLALSGGRLRRLIERTECYVPTTPVTAPGVLPWRPSPVLGPWLRLTIATPAGLRTVPWSTLPRLRAGSPPRVELDDPAPRFVKLHTNLPSPWIFDLWGWAEL